MHGSTLRLHGTGGTGRIFEPLSVQVEDLKKAGQLFDRHGSISRTDLCKHPNRATFYSDSAVKAWNQMPRLAEICTDPCKHHCNRICTDPDKQTVQEQNSSVQKFVPTRENGALGNKENCG